MDGRSVLVAARVLTGSADPGCGRLTDETSVLEGDLTAWPALEADLTPWPRLEVDLTPWPRLEVDLTPWPRLEADFTPWPAAALDALLVGARVPNVIKLLIKLGAFGRAEGVVVVGEVGLCGERERFLVPRRSNLNVLTLRGTRGPPKNRLPLAGFG